MNRTRNIIALLLALAISFAALGAYALAVTADTPTNHKNATLMSIPLPPMASYSLWPDTPAGYWSYIDYKHAYAVGAYECASGYRQSGMLGSNTYTKACVDWYIIVKAKAIRARLFHATDYYKYWYLNAIDYAYWRSIVVLYTAWAKNYSQTVGSGAYWSAELGVCGALIGKVAATGGNWMAGLAGGGCHYAFDKLNPYGSL